MATLPYTGDLKNPKRKSAGPMVTLGTQPPVARRKIVKRLTFVCQTGNSSTVLIGGIVQVPVTGQGIISPSTGFNN